MKTSKSATTTEVKYTWIARGKGTCGKHYTLLADGKPAGITVQHCGHPTALWPYAIIRRPEEGMFLAPSGHGFHLLQLAKDSAIALYSGACHILPSTSTRYHVAGRIVIQEPNMPRPQKPIDETTFRGQIAARIRARRLKLKLTGEQAAERAGVPVQTWYHWEQGYRLPLDELPRIAQALKTRPRGLLPA